MIELAVFIFGFVVGMGVTGFVAVTSIEFYKNEIKNARIQ